VTGDGDKSWGRATRRYYSICESGCDINYIEYAAKTDTAILLGSSIQHSTSLILKYSTLIASTLHKLTLLMWWSYSTLLWLSRLNVGSQIDRCCSLVSPSHSNDRTIDQILADFPRTENLSVRWNTHTAQYLLSSSYFDSTFNFGRLALLSLAFRLLLIDRFLTTLPFLVGYAYIYCSARDAFVLTRSRAALSRAQHHTRNTRALASVVREEINSQTTKFIKGNGKLYFITDNSKQL